MPKDLARGGTGGLATDRGGRTGGVATDRGFGTTDRGAGTGGVATHRGVGTAASWGGALTMSSGISAVLCGVERTGHTRTGAETSDDSVDSDPISSHDDVGEL